MGPLGRGHGDQVLPTRLDTQRGTYVLIDTVSG